MFKTLFLVAAVALPGLFCAPRAEAGPLHQSVTYRSGTTACGCPIYTRRYVRGYDSCRRPIYGYCRVPLSHGRTCRHVSSYRRSSYRSHCHGPVIRRTVRAYQPRVILSSRSSSRRCYRGTSFSFSIGGISFR
ncbi:MAG: hypothetical protein CMP28_13640 [Roseibacillus sp.]|nr:hypothetical protein [Roseibacillus sp.]